MIDRTDLPDKTAALQTKAGREDFYTFIVEGLVDLAIYKLSRTGVIETWSRGAERLMGYSAEEVIGRNFAMFYTEPDNDSNFPQYELKEAERIGRFEGAGRRKRKDGQQIWVNVIIAALRDREGKLQGYVKVVRDATERKRSEQIATRGAAIAVAQIDTITNKVVYAGLGNIAAHIVTASTRTGLISVPGIAGYQMRKIREFFYEWDADSVLIMNTDGLRSSIQLQGLNGHHPTLIAGTLYSRYKRASDDACVLVAKNERRGQVRRNDLLHARQ